MMSLGLTVMIFPGTDAMAMSNCVHRDLDLADNSYYVFIQLADMAGFLNDRDIAAMPEFKRIRTRPLPSGQTVGVLKEEEGMVEEAEDMNDRPLRFAYVRDLKKVVLPEDTSPFNRAALAYIRELPDDYVGVLYWR